MYRERWKISFWCCVFFLSLSCSRSRAFVCARFKSIHMIIKQIYQEIHSTGYTPNHRVAWHTSHNASLKSYRNLFFLLLDGKANECKTSNANAWWTEAREKEIQQHTSDTFTWIGAWLTKRTNRRKKEKADIYNEKEQMQEERERKNEIKINEKWQATETDKCKQNHKWH